MRLSIRRAPHREQSGRSNVRLLGHRSSDPSHARSAVEFKPVPDRAGNGRCLDPAEPTALITGVQRAISSSTMRRLRPGSDRGCGSNPDLTRSSRKAGSAIVVRVAWESCAMIGLGVPAGRTGRGNSARSCRQPRLRRRSGRRAARSSAPVWWRRSASTCPSRPIATTWPVTFRIASGMCPLTTSVSAGPPPRYGTWTMSGIPVSDLNSSPVR